jgi:hypothetical protein
MLRKHATAPQSQEEKNSTSSTSLLKISLPASHRVDFPCSSPVLGIQGQAEVTLHWADGSVAGPSLLPPLQRLNKYTNQHHEDTSKHN